MINRAEYVRERRVLGEARRRFYLREAPQRWAEMPFGALWHEFTGEPLNPQSSLNQQRWQPSQRGEEAQLYGFCDDHRIRHPQPERAMTAGA